MSCFSGALDALPEFTALCNAIQQNRLPVAASGFSHIHKAHMIHSLCVKLSRRALVLTADEGEATRLVEDLNAMGGEDTALLYPARDFNFYHLESRSHEYEHRRLRTLHRMLRGDYQVTVCSIDAALQCTLPAEALAQHSLHLEVNQEITPGQVVEALVKAGYVRSDLVEGSGQFSHRGGILDFYPIQTDFPVRMEFFGDSIDTLGVFDPVTQRRMDAIKCIDIPPATEMVFSAPGELAQRIEAFAEQLRGKSTVAKAKLLEEADRLRGAGHLPSMDKYLDIVYERPASLFDYAGDSLLFCSESGRVKEQARSVLWRHHEDLQALFEEGTLCKGLDRFYFEWEEMTASFESKPLLYLETLPKATYDIPPRELVTLQAMQLSLWGGGFGQLLEDLQPALEKKYACLVLTLSERAVHTLAQDLQKEGIAAAGFPALPDALQKGVVSIAPGTLSGGVEYPELGLLCLSHGQSTAGKAKKIRPRHKLSGNAIGSLEELQRGDYVVHSIHGIGIFEGIHKLQVDGLTKDYIKIQYAKQDTLYVPVTQLDLVSKYIGAGEEGNVRVHTLGGVQWQKTKQRVRASLKDMAKELTALYAKRMQLKGHAFLPDGEEQRDFEDRFEYEETEDQLRCVREIKRDMERSTPMERLLCGDVGFGKTEVALRAAFKCLSEGKQCAFLVPTTILALQHYQTIQQRMEGFAINVEMLSRFRSAADQQKILAGIRRGTIDMVVGTHRLISKDIAFKDLGILIVDEEQRFGVAQKERMKELFPKVDVLTLSATPIPRTLNMAMSGIRDMSLLEEPPHDRHPVQSYVLEYDSGILMDAIRRELRRGGQVYYLHNRVENIDRTAYKLGLQLPEAKIAVAHGQMPEETLSEIWRGLLEHKIDILVCTTIIETGVDVQNVNTLIIEDADRMGLAQLHQIRGRVGRSSRRAYAYFTFTRGKVLSDISTRRLNAIREFTEFGSGFKIAMRDLEIRGAGNILGAQQHGHMEAVGYDMYLKMLQAAMKAEQGGVLEEPVEEPDCLVDLQVEAHIPERYIESIPQRLTVYRLIAGIRSKEDAMEVYDELIDRYGDPPKAVQGLIDVAMLRNMAIAMRIDEINQKGDRLILKWSKPDMEKVAKIAEHFKRRALFHAIGEPHLSVTLLPLQQPIELLRETLLAATQTE